MSIERISIVHCIGSLRIGGAERQLVELITRLPADRFDQSLVMFRAEGELIPQVEAAGCKIIGLLPPERDRRSRFRSTMGQMIAVSRLVRYLRQRRPDIE